jgi:alpha-N-arabinofuranosidase
MVNVLQAMILTDGLRMVLTPSYHAFMLYQPFQGAEALPVRMASPRLRTGEHDLPALDLTAARDASGGLHIGIVNIDPWNGAELDLELPGFAGRKVEGQILTAPRTDSRNSLDGRQEVAPASFTGARWQGAALRVSMPSKAIVRLTLR